MSSGLYRCIICGKGYAKELSLYGHITSHTQDIYNLSGSTDPGQEGKSDCKRYACMSCGYSAEMTKTPKHHGRTHPENVGTNKENRVPEDDMYLTRKCTDSGEIFYGNRDLESRAKEDGEGTSGACPKKCDSKYDVLWHVKSPCESQVSKLKCNSCDEVYQVSPSSGSGGVCDFCGHQLTKIHPLGQKSQRLEEIGGETEESEEVYDCDTCKNRFTCKKDLLCHLKVHFKAERKKRSRQRRTGSEETEKIAKKKKSEKPFKCDEENCRYATSQFSLLKTHKFKHNPFFKCVTCHEKFSTRVELKNHMSSHGERPFKCDQCNKCYKDKHGLGWHKKVQHDPSRLKFTCELCGKTYPFDSLLTQHINLTHAAEKQSVCDICGKNVSKTYLPMHRRTHGEKQYSCEICEKTFLEKAYLKRHKMVHTGEKPYICSVCGNSFRQHSTLTIHMRTHTGDRPYKCVLCENAYKTHHNLKKHYKRSGHKLV